MAHIEIAIVDDHALIRGKLVKLINSFPGFTVVMQAINGKDFLEKLENAPSLPEVCLLDINMPVLNGYETLKIIRKRWSDLKVLSLSFADTECTVKEMFALGANGFILKDSSIKKFATAIETIHNGGLYFPEAILQQREEILKDHLKSNGKQKCESGQMGSERMTQ